MTLEELTQNYRAKLSEAEIARQAVSDIAIKHAEAARRLEKAELALSDAGKLLLAHIASSPTDQNDTR